MRLAIPRSTLQGEIWKAGEGGTVNLVVFQDSDLREMALHEWLDLRRIGSL